MSPRRRADDGPIAPRVGAPDLPRVLDAARAPGRGDDVEAVRIEHLEDGLDAPYASIEASVVEHVSGERIDLTGATLLDVDALDLRVTHVAGRGARWRRVRIAGGRIGTLDLSDADLDEVELRELRIDFLSLAGARVADLEISGCTITSIDLPGARVERMRVSSSRSDELDTRELRATDVDLRGLDVADVTAIDGLRGATLTPRQVEGLAAAFAKRAGIDVRDE